MNKEKAQEIASFLAGKSHRLSGREANEFFQLYKSWINPKAKIQPCGCNPNEWKRMMEETLEVVDKTLSTETINLMVYEIPGDNQTPMIDNTVTQQPEVDQDIQEKPKGRRKIVS
jgi:hypothetical protein